MFYQKTKKKEREREKQKESKTVKIVCNPHPRS